MFLAKRITVLLFLAGCLLSVPSAGTGYRHRYYTDSRYQPIYWGSSVGGGGYYDDYDFRSFDTVGDPQVEGDFAGAGAGGDFFDS